MALLRQQGRSAENHDSVNTQSDRHAAISFDNLSADDCGVSSSSLSSSSSAACVVERLPSPSPPTAHPSLSDAELSAAVRGAIKGGDLEKLSLKHVIASVQQSLRLPSDFFSKSKEETRIHYLRLKELTAEIAAEGLSQPAAKGDTAEKGEIERQKGRRREHEENVSSKKRRRLKKKVRSPEMESANRSSRKLVRKPKQDSEEEPEEEAEEEPEEEEETQSAGENDSQFGASDNTTPSQDGERKKRRTLTSSKMQKTDQRQIAEKRDKPQASDVSTADRNWTETHEAARQKLRKIVAQMTKSPSIYRNLNKDSMSPEEYLEALENRVIEFARKNNVVSAARLPNSKELAAFKALLATRRELEGIDTANIIDSAESRIAGMRRRDLSRPVGKASKRGPKRKKRDTAFDSEGDSEKSEDSEKSGDSECSESFPKHTNERSAGRLLKRKTIHGAEDAGYEEVEEQNGSDEESKGKGKNVSQGDDEQDDGQNTRADDDANAEDGEEELGEEEEEEEEDDDDVHYTNSEEEESDDESQDSGDARSDTDNDTSAKQSKKKPRSAKHRHR